MGEVRIAAFDFGEKRIGVAIANSIAKIASPLTVIANDQQKWQAIDRLIKEHAITKLAVGLPRNMSGEETAQSKLCRDFAKELESHTGLEVRLVDESLTSVLSEQRLSSSKTAPSKEDIDMQAAVKILNDYLGV